MKDKTLKTLYKSSRDISLICMGCIIGLFVLALVAILLDGCAPTKGLTQPQSNLLKFYSIYNSQYDNYQRQTEDPSTLSEEKKMILRKKREILVEMHRLIKLYEIAMNLNNVEDISELEQGIFDLIDKLE